MPPVLHRAVDAGAMPGQAHYVTGIPRSRFELATAELHALGITLTRLPGEYRVNLGAGRESTARTMKISTNRVEHRPRCTLQ